MPRSSRKPTTIESTGCLWHQPSGLSYIAWHDDADRRGERGEKQRRCPDCKLYFWPHEYGEKPDA